MMLLLRKCKINDSFKAAPFKGVAFFYDQKRHTSVRN